jgi:hypothetical protein
MMPCDRCAELEAALIVEREKLAGVQGQLDELRQRIEELYRILKIAGN